MTQNNNIINENDIAMKKVLELFKSKQKTEDNPKITVKSVKPFTPEERERYNRWCRELNVSALWEDNRLRLG
jgi:hypothetical protein